MRRCIAARCARQLTATLRGIIQDAPSSGISFADVEAKLKEHMQTTTVEKEAERGQMFSSWVEKLHELSDVHYVCGTTLYPCNWEETMRNVAALMPHEGVTEKEFINLIVGIEAFFSSSSIHLGEPLCRWVQRRFSHIVQVSLSATNGTPLYRAVDEPLSPEAECITRVLQLLGRGKLPVYTDFGIVAPLLPASMRPEKGNFIKFLEGENVRRYFDVDVEASVRLSSDRPPFTVCVDGTSVEIAQIHKILASMGLLDSLPYIKVFRRDGDPSWSTDDVVVQGFLEPEHVIGATIASMKKRSCANVYVLCGDVVRERYKAALMDLQGANGAGIRICTPNDGVVMK